MDRKFLIAANWKMNPIPQGALLKDSSYQMHADIDVVVFPTFLDVRSCIEAGLMTGGQYGHPEEAGAHTGDVSIVMLAKARCRYVLCGHSERRVGHHETDDDVAAQVIAALEARIHPIVCIGETAQERKKGQEKDVIKRRINSLPLESDLTIAYEPIWAIGTGNTATAKQAQEMQAFIRSLLPSDRQEKTCILYGGSLKPENAEELLKQKDIDGGLVGSASLDLEAFGRIVEIAKELQETKKLRN